MARFAGRRLLESRPTWSHPGKNYAASGETQPLEIRTAYLERLGFLIRLIVDSMHFLLQLFDFFPVATLHPDI